MKRIAVLLMLLGIFIGTTVADAQELKFSIVGDIEADQFDMTAREENRNDGDGYAYAIIKVTSDIEDDDLSKFNFSFGYIKSEKEMHDGELWIYVARGAKTVDIRREGYKPILKHSFKAIKEGTTYTMKLSVQTPETVNRVLQFKVEPVGENAIVKVKPEGSDGGYELWGTVDVTGSINRLLETGVYLYEVSAGNYVTSQGRVTLTANADGETFVEQVRLTPNFGFLKIDDVQGIAGAEVYVNDMKVGTVPYRSERMECRDDYRLMINHELYRTYSGTFAITCNDTTRLSPRLESNFAETTIRVDGEAEIFINGESRGHGTWTGPLRAGSYSVECRLPNHIPSTKQIVVRPDFAETFLMDSPMPIEGSLYVSTNPSGASIFIDGEDKGFVAPRNIGNMLIGHHQVTIKLANYRTETLDVDIRQGETAQLNVNLRDYQSVDDVTLDKTALSLGKGETATLIATVQPEDATDRGVTWSSSDPSVASVSSGGKVTAVNSGTATVTATSVSDAGMKATCTVTVVIAGANGHDYVDLGLSSGTLWATCNVGATSPEEYGNYYAWGETETKSSYTESNYNYSSNPATLPADRDAARANWGGSWSMPTTSEFKELYNECTWTWTTMNGKNGYKVSSKKNSSYIFLPVAGYFGSSLNFAGSYGYYWSSSLYTSLTSLAFELSFTSGYVDPSDSDGRCYGRSVRPVLRK